MGKKQKIHSSIKPSKTQKTRWVGLLKTVFLNSGFFLAKEGPFGGLDTIRLHLGGQTPINLPKMGKNRHFAVKSAK